VDCSPLCNVNSRASAEKEEEEEEEREGEGGWPMVEAWLRRGDTTGGLIGVGGGHGGWWRKKKSCRGERLGDALTIWGGQAVSCDGDGGVQFSGDDVGGWMLR